MKNYAIWYQGIVIRYIQAESLKDAQQKAEKLYTGSVTVTED